jgi:membrane protease YdiL (CAAX protease family)
MQAYSEYNLKLFISLAYGVTLPFWLAGAYLSSRHSPGASFPALYNAAMICGLAAPFLVSISMILTSGDRELTRSYLHRLIDPKLMQPGNIPTFLLFMPMVVLASLLISILFGEPVTQFQLAEHPPGAGRMAPGVVSLLIAATAGELGWRGYTFDGLHARYDLFRASIILSVLWALWLLPLLLVGGSFPHGLMLQNPWVAVNFYLGLVPLSVLVSWVYAENGNSLLTAVLFHGAVVLCTEALSLTELTRVIQNVVLAVACAGIVATERDLFFGAEHAQRTTPLRRRST